MDDSCILWPKARPECQLAANSVHVLALELDVAQNTLDRLAGTLAPMERRRAASFHFERDRNRFVAGRGALRSILGRYLQASPEAVALEYGPKGKPLLADRFARSGIHFNLAHSEDLALVALAQGRDVGVDLERVRNLDDAEELASCFCAPSEFQEFRSVPEQGRSAAFFRIWTRKEAWLKATGKGIGHWLDKVEVSFRADERPRFVKLPKETATNAEGWNLQEFIPAPGFMAALAVPGEAPEISCWKFAEEEKFEYA
jgi:4'-phosphopantetheinyl transferase